MAKKRREDQIIRFREALSIAENLGLEKRVDTTNIIQTTARLDDNNPSIKTPLYYIGSNALKAEIYNLENRITDDPFISGLRDIEEQLTILKTIKITKEKFSAAKIDRKAFPPLSHIYPNRRLILLAGIALGFIAGIFLVMLLNIFKKKN